jgi:hypothetical protein
MGEHFMKDKEKIKTMIETIDFDKEVFLKRKEIDSQRDLTYSTIEIDLEDDVVKRLSLLAEKEGVSDEEYIVELLYLMILNQETKPEGITKTIDTVYFMTKTTEVLESGENFMLVDYENMDNKVVLVTDKKMVRTISKLEENKKTKRK